MIRIHGSAVLFEGAGVLLRGPSGSGKSDLALRLIDGGAVLVADDQTELHLDRGRVTMTAPAAIAGRLEVRGVGILDLPWRQDVALRLVVELRPAAQIERLPEPAWCRFFEYDFPSVAVAPFEASAPAKLRQLVRRLASGLADAAE
ncbi:MAG: HPr kinase/phosphorylase [Stellaceae bacterium]